MVYVILGYGSIMALIALVIGWALMYPTIKSSPIASYRQVLIRNGIIRTMGGLVIYYISLTFLALNPDTVPVLNKIVTALTHVGSSVITYMANQSLYDLLLWVLMVFLGGMVGWLMGRGFPQKPHSN